MSRLSWDEQLREQFKQQPAMPTVIRQRIDETLAQLPDDAARLPFTDILPIRKVGWFAWLLGRRMVIAAALAAIVIGFVSLSGAGSSSFADSVRPLLNSIFAWMGDDGLVSNVEERDSEPLPILTEVEDQGYTLRIHEVQYDALRLSFSYSLEFEDGLDKELHVIPGFELDRTIKELAPNTLKSDSGGTSQQEKVGIVNYFFTEPVPDRMQLKINVPLLAFVEKSTAGQTVLPGDWSFTVDAVKQGETTVRTYTHATAVIKQPDLIQLRVVKARLTGGAAEWRLHWELPEPLVAANRDNATIRYGVKYNIVYDGAEPLTVITSVSSGRVADRELPEQDWLHLEDVRLLTSPVPAGVKSVTIVPVLMEYRLNSADAGYSERPLKQLAVEVPVEQPEQQRAD